MKLVLDVGNSAVKVGVYDSGAPRVERLSRMPEGPLEWSADLADWLATHEVDASALNGSALASVVPSATAGAALALATLTGRPPLLLRPLPPNLPVYIRYTPRESLGQDRLAAAIGAVAHVSAPCIVWSLGTAFTGTLVDPSRAILGGCILPGPDLGARALSEHTALLPLVTLDALDDEVLACVGEDTEASIRVGLIEGAIGAVERLTTLYRARLGERTPVVVTGGWASRLQPHVHIASPLVFAPNLVLDGLASLL